MKQLPLMKSSECISNYGLSYSYPIALVAMNIVLILLIMSRRYALEQRLNWD